MTISDFDKFDMILTKKKDDGLRLIIVDPGNLVDKDRLYAFRRKLKAYQGALETSEFRDKNPNWRNTKIQVDFAAEPTDAMKEISAISFEADGEKFQVPIVFEYVEPSLISGNKWHLVDVNYNYKNLSEYAIGVAKDFIKLESFTPFGCAWSFTGNIKSFDVSLVPPDDQIPSVKKSLQKISAEDEEVQAVALAYDVLAIHPDQTEKTDAIAIDLEHRLGNPITMLVHYQLKNGEVDTLKPYGVEKDAELLVVPSGIVAAEAVDEDSGAGSEEVDEQSWLESTPTVCFLLVAAIDGSIDKKETVAFVESLQRYTQHSNPLVKEVFSAAMERFQEDFAELLGLGKAGAMLMPVRLGTSRNYALKKAPAHAEEFFQVLIEMSTAIASASGGFLGIGSKISKEEKTALSIIESMLTVKKEDS